jgi:hypothetical protein
MMYEKLTLWEDWNGSAKDGFDCGRVLKHITVVLSALCRLAMPT